ncbi:DoxX family membrane protein [Cytobacillus solani]|uniref:DoxX family membrane protein n=1 Tax=Cytobacillus solani TaxID=1637975 RepID=UPI0006AB7F40|nr:DoxX family membrane protein [Cytobacillus solani]KOP83024.1 Crp/Fnr family transcriptional regulator [Bacillus sp. FJAT-21945]USK53300.1 DoxX family membrane protein [Cytobacillus solani]
MFIKWIRESQIAAGILTIIRLYVGYSWITAGYGKLTGGFDASGFLQGAVANATGDHPAVQAWWASFLEGIAIPNAGLFSFLVSWGELLVGLGLILGCLTTAAAFFGILMNFSFLFSGTVSTNAQMVLLTFFILIAGFNAGKIGLDRYVIPFIRKQSKGRFSSGESIAS